MVRATATSAFGVGRRESHDASGFYDRFEPPELTIDDTIEPLLGLSQGAAACIQADARHMLLPDGAALPDNSVALVVTSPPYFSGKEYEQALGRGHIPGTYLEYLEMLREVFSECKRVLEPGGRIAVNVANLGRKPYRSLSADVIRILQDDLRLLLRGEIIWRKAEGASGSCAWGSFASASNPVLRDVTERVIVASKGRFDRTPTSRRRRESGLPHADGITPEEFMEATLDVWSMAPERASRVGHPAPFPVELPQRLIELYTFREDVVVDPFMGSGSTLVAAIRGDRRYLGYDTDPEYVAIARRRVKDELRGRASLRVVGGGGGFWGRRGWRGFRGRRGWWGFRDRRGGRGGRGWRGDRRGRPMLAGRGGVAAARPGGLPLADGIAGGAAPGPAPRRRRTAPAVAAGLLEEAGFRIVQRNGGPRRLGWSSAMWPRTPPASPGTSTSAGRSPPRPPAWLARTPFGGHSAGPASWPAWARPPSCS